MNDDNRFFRWLLRIDAILFFLAAACVVAMVTSSLGFWRSAPEEAPAAAQTKSGEDIYAFGGTVGLPIVSTGQSLLNRLQDTDEGVMVLQRSRRDGSYGSFSGRGSNSSDVNLLLVDLNTMKNRWLFAGVKRDIGTSLIVQTDMPDRKDVKNPVTALLMPVAETDTNGDGQLTAADDHALYVYRLGGAAPFKLFDAKAISNMEQLDSTRILVTYYDGKADHAMLVSAKDFKTIADSAISSMPK